MFLSYDVVRRCILELSADIEENVYPIKHSNCTVQVDESILNNNEV